MLGVHSRRESGKCGSMLPLSMALGRSRFPWEVTEKAQSGRSHGRCPDGGVLIRADDIINYLFMLDYGKVRWSGAGAL
jgi:hypothetical protein